MVVSCRYNCNNQHSMDRITSGVRYRERNDAIHNFVCHTTRGASSYKARLNKIEAFDFICLE